MRQLLATAVACPQCAAPLNAVTSRVHKAPSAGDILLCAKCRTLLTLDDDLQPRTQSPAELLALQQSAEWPELQRELDYATSLSELMFAGGDETTLDAVIGQRVTWCGLSDSGLVVVFAFATQILAVEYTELQGIEALPALRFKVGEPASETSLKDIQATTVQNGQTRALRGAVFKGLDGDKLLLDDKAIQMTRSGARFLKLRYT